ncbi:MAG: hypothetical protein A3K46_00990 [Chloroflexi bacterium RBG_13_60_9]|nr:MAG: hypothetical protein A3K46_00990 [Chloroflexi bacterium RBG_13_60_9]
MRGLIELPDAKVDMEKIEQILRFADPVGAMVTKQRGQSRLYQQSWKSGILSARWGSLWLGNSDDLDK